MPNFLIGPKQGRSEFKFIIVAALLVSQILHSFTLEHKPEDGLVEGSLWCGTYWLVPLIRKIKGHIVLPYIGCPIIGEILPWRPGASPSRDGGNGLWDKIAYNGGYYYVNHKDKSLAIGLNEKNELVCSTVENAIFFMD
jgi:hypothetical protein